jgi:hypothetical protein
LRHRGGGRSEQLLGGGEQVAAFAGSFGGQQGGVESFVYAGGLMKRQVRTCPLEGNAL